MKIKVMYDVNGGHLCFARQFGQPSERLVKASTCPFKSDASGLIETPRAPLCQLIDYETKMVSRLCNDESLKAMKIREYMFLGWCIRCSKYTYNKKKDSMHR